MAKPTLYILGMPLNDEGTPHPSVGAVLEGAQAIIAERRKQAFPYFRRLGLKLAEERLFFLDPPREAESEALYESLKALRKTGGTAALLSDCGMPLLFDPGREVLNKARALGFEIRTEPGATSWATAMCISGWEPPFWIEGFLPQKKHERTKRLQQLKANPGHKVLMDTPYRFEQLVNECIETWGQQQPCFLAWNIAQLDERYMWATLKELSSTELKKGEFILLVE